MFVLFIFYCRLGYMFWSDVGNKVITAARLNGTGITTVVNSSISVPGNICLLVHVKWLVLCIVRFYKARYKSQ